MPLNLITEKIYNIETGEEKIVERDETDAETKTRLAREKAQAAADAAAAEKAAEKTAILTRLGLTEDELKTILG